MEEFEYYIDGKRASEDDVNGELDYQAKWYAMDTGIYDDYMQGQIAESDYEAFILWNLSVTFVKTLNISSLFGPFSIIFHLYLFFILEIVALFTPNTSKPKPCFKFSLCIKSFVAFAHSLVSLSFIPLNVRTPIWLKGGYFNTSLNFISLLKYKL